jgi:D-cysteine desulfhydrase
MTTASASQPALFDRFPELSQRIPWVSLETSPSPVQRLANLGHESVWIKRDDIVSTVYGGNKVRKLEFALAEAVQRRKQRVVTIGALGTNHGLATAIFCRRIGLDCTILLFDHPVTCFVRRNLLLAHEHGAELVYSGNVTRAGVRYYLGARLGYRNAFFLGAGGSSPRGTLGAVSGALELAAQVERGLCPAPDYVICPTASNGTMGGLILGFMLAGLETRVVGVRVSLKRVGPLAMNTSGTVAKMTKSVHRLMARHVSSLPDLQFEKPLLLDGYCGDGYGWPTPAGRRAMEIFRDHEGIALDPVYTGKACAALLDFIGEPGHAADTILYWHTLGSVDDSRLTRGLDHRRLPSELHPFFETEPLRN